MGGLSLEHGDGAVAPAVQRKRLVLLAVLAVAGPRGVSRDKLLAYLWPESDTERARQSLKHAVYSLRQTFGDEALHVGPTELCLDLGVVRCDVVEFERALGARDDEQAVALYTGSFLDGVHLPDVPELERWIEEERSRLAIAHAAAVERLARRTAAEGSLTGAVHWWRRLSALDPTSSRVTLELMRALAAAGDIPGALMQARVHSSLVRQELESGPDPAVVALAELLRATSPVRMAIDIPSVGPTSDTHTIGPDIEHEADGVASWPVALAENRRRFLRDLVNPRNPSSPTTRGPHDPVARTGRRWRKRAPAALTVAVLGLAAAGAVVHRDGISGDSAIGRDQSVIAVLPFATRGTSDVAYLAQGMVDLLATNLDGAGDLHTVDPRALLTFVERDERKRNNFDHAGAIAQHFGAGRYLLGSVTGAGRQLRLSAALYDAESPAVPLVRATAVGNKDELFALADTLTMQLLAGLPGGPATRLARIAAVTTTSLPALKAYLIGESNVRRARYVAAVENFRIAVAHDSGFSLAHYRLSRAADWADQIALARVAAERAARDTGRLSAHDRLLVTALAAQRRGAADEAERIYRQVVSAHPTDVEAWYQLGEVLFHHNGSRGRSLLEARTPYERALRLTPHDRESLLHLARIAAADADQRWFDSLHTALVASDPAGQDAELRVLRAFTFGHRWEQDRVLAALDTAADQTVHNHCWRVAVYGRNVRDAARICRLLTDSRRVTEVRALGHQRLADLALAQGRLREARRELVALSGLLPEWGAALAAFYTVVPLAPTPASEIRAARDRLARMNFRAAPSRVSLHLAVLNGRHEIVRRYVIGYLDASLSRSGGVLPRGAAAEQLLSSADTGAALMERNVALSLAAYAEARQGNGSLALALLNRTKGDRYTGDLWQGALVYDRYLRAELLRRLGRDEEAAGWYESFSDPQVYDLAYAGQGAFMSAQVNERLGRIGKAAAQYERFIALWEGCDPELRPLVERARERVRALR